MTAPPAQAPAPDGPIGLRLFVAGTNARSLRTIGNLRRLCALHLPPDVTIEVVDVYQQPHLADADRVVAAPMLVKLAPGPVRRIVGDLSDARAVLARLDLGPGPDQP